MSNIFTKVELRYVTTFGCRELELWACIRKKNALGCRTKNKTKKI